uniref:Uncharacterized protein n=1 Tax=Anguilla anguilla TaxID=7936 RepID=A0A0E9VHU1_ANGAN
MCLTSSYLTLINAYHVSRTAGLAPPVLGLPSVIAGKKNLIKMLSLSKVRTAPSLACIWKGY